MWLAESREQQWVRGYLPGPMTESSTTMTATARNRPRLQSVSTSSSSRLSFGPRVSNMPGALPSE